MSRAALTTAGPWAETAAPQTALLAFGCIHDALVLLSRAHEGFGAGLAAFELVSGSALELVARHLPEQPIPVETRNAPWYALIELAGREDETQARARFAAVVGASFEDGLVADAAVAENTAQRESLWRLRNAALVQAQQRDGRTLAHAVSVPVARIPDFLRSTAAALEARWPGVRPVVFGRPGAGTLHYGVALPPGLPTAALEDAIRATVRDSVQAHGGTFLTDTAA